MSEKEQDPRLWTAANTDENVTLNPPMSKRSRLSGSPQRCGIPNNSIEKNRNTIIRAKLSHMENSLVQANHILKTCNAHNALIKRKCNVL